MTCDYTIHHGDCLDVLPTIPDHSMHLICCDPPYGSTDCEWDVRLPMQPLWEQYRRLLVPGGAVVLFADLRFAIDLIGSAPKNWYRYELVWDKVSSAGFLDANRRPLRRHEYVLVFGPRMPVYRPQLTEGKPYSTHQAGDRAAHYGRHRRIDSVNTGTRHPTSILRFPRPCRQGHPTAKPVELLEWLIKTYSDEGHTVLDNAMGSGSCGVACLNTNRRFIGVERDMDYFGLAERRLREAVQGGDADEDAASAPSGVESADGPVVALVG